jgi:hypothetical protein
MPNKQMADRLLLMMSSLNYGHIGAETTENPDANFCCKKNRPSMLGLPQNPKTPH